MNFKRLTFWLLGTGALASCAIPSNSPRQRCLASADNPLKTPCETDLMDSQNVVTWSFDDVLAEDPVSELRLSSREVKILREQSKGLVSFEDFRKTLPLKTPHLYLGIYGSRLTFGDLIAPSGLQLPDLRKFRSDRLEASIEDALKGREGAVFFLPPNVLNFHNGFPVTAQELDLLLQRPSLLRKTLFVYGAYESGTTTLRSLK